MNSVKIVKVDGCGIIGENSVGHHFPVSNNEGCYIKTGDKIHGYYLRNKNNGWYFELNHKHKYGK